MMASRKSRRSFLGLLGAGASGGVVLAGAVVPGQEPPQRNRPKGNTFRGTSKKGNLQEALALAVQAAQQSARGADRQVEWTLKEVHGRQGGLKPIDEVTVVIEARLG